MWPHFIAVQHLDALTGVMELLSQGMGDGGFAGRW
jgi:hypothetical protein